jgi:kynurenine formamidase
VLGVDTASPDGSGDADDADALAAHRVLLGADRLIIENLRGLTGLPRTVEFTALPLSIAGGDGAPVRAVARY